MGKRLEGVSGVVKVGVVGGRLSGAIPMGLPAMAVTCCGGVVDVADVLWLKVAVARVASVSRTLESWGLVVLEVLLPSDKTTENIIQNKEGMQHSENYCAVANSSNVVFDVKVGSFTRALTIKRF